LLTLDFILFNTAIVAAKEKQFKIPLFYSLFLFFFLIIGTFSKQIEHEMQTDNKYNIFQGVPLIVTNSNCSNRFCSLLVRFLNFCSIQIL